MRQEPSGGWGEFALVIVGAFGFFILSSLYAVFHLSTQSGHSTGSLIGLVVQELIVLVVLAIILHQRGWTMQGLGLSFRWWDIPIGIGLACAVDVVCWICYYLFTLAAPDLAARAGTVAVIQPGISLISVLAVTLVNPIYEELFVAGYVIAALKDNKGSSLAINISVALRLAYHLYQGVLGVVMIVPVGLIFATYFARTQRLWPLIVAHALLDGAALGYYTRW